MNRRKHPSRNTLLTTVALGAVLALTACSSSPLTEYQEDRAESLELAQEIEDRQNAQRQEVLEEELDQVPEWVLQPPVDGAAMIGVGTGVDTDYSRALAKASLLSEYELASKIRGELSGNTRSYDATGEGAPDRQRFVQMVERLVTPTSVRHMTEVKRKIVPMNGEYHAFVMSRITLADIEQTLTEGADLEMETFIQEEFERMRERLRQLNTESQANGSESPSALSSSS